MKKSTVFCSLIAAIIVISFLSQIGFMPEKKVGAVTLPKSNPCLSEKCKQMEADILRSTVRLQLQVWQVKPDESGFELDYSIGHATLRNGRYLVTHNHYAPLDQLGLPDTSINAVIFDSNGTLLVSAPLIDFEITKEAEETLVLEMKHDYLAEQLAAAGITSAEFRDWHSLQLQPGMEVAQVDWDGYVARVDWTTIDEILPEEEVPRLILNDSLTKGSSGGGVFWNGIHIANNWRSFELLDDADNIIRAISLASLNGY